MKTVTNTFKAALLAPLLLLAASHSVASAAQPQKPPPVPPRSAQPPAPRPAATPHPPKIVADPAARAGWTRYQFGDAPAFSVLLPARPSASAVSLASREEPNVAGHYYFAEGASAIFTAQRIDGFSEDLDRAPETAKQGLFTTFIKGFLDGFSEEMRRGGINFTADLRASKKVKAAGRDAFEQEFAYGPLDGRAQVVFAGRAVFVLAAVWSRDGGSAPERETFFQSFRLGPAGQPN